MSVPYQPKGFHTLNPYLIVNGAAAAIEFYIQAFGAKENLRLGPPDGSAIYHAELQIGDSILMLGEAAPDYGYPGPVEGQSVPAHLMFYVPDVDAVFARALELGATVKRPIANMFYGDRTGSIIDPFGHQWSLATHIEEVPAEELLDRMMKQG